jgi:hypothetical protein
VAALNVAMGLGGLAVGYREVAAETLWMFVPGAPERVWHSDFAMGSPLVRRAVRELLDEARRRGGGRQRLELGPRSIAWSRRDLERDSRRVALALNSPLRLEATAHRQAEGWRLELRGRAAVRYPRRSRTLLGRFFGQEFVIEEGLFAALQDAGWLHPFDVVWCPSPSSPPHLIIFEVSTQAGLDTTVKAGTDEAENHRLPARPGSALGGRPRMWPPAAHAP